MRSLTGLRFGSFCFGVSMDEEKDTTEEVKVGARNSKRDAERLQTMHDYAVENGAICNTEGKALDPDEVLITFGSEVKALEGGKVAGYLVRYSNPDEPDLTGDYFVPETDFGDFKSSPVLYQHGLDQTIKRRKIGDGQLSQDDVGVWIEAQLNLRDEYEKAIYQMAKDNKLGWSSGTAGHLVERDRTGKILAWPLGLDASLTPTPAEPRNHAVTLKSLITTEADERSGAEPISGTDKGDVTAAKTAKEIDMELNEFKTLLEDNNKSLVATIEEKAAAAAVKAVEEKFDSLPEVKAAMNGKAQVTLDEADRPFKSVAEQMLAQKNAANGRIDPRLKRIQKLSQDWMAGNEEQKALLGSNETIPSQGEFLLEPTISAEFLAPLHEEGPISKLAKRMPVGPNSVGGWINGADETSRVLGSRWGGVRGYWLAEGDAMTASQPKFKRINWELHQLAVLQYATDYMLKDAQLMDSVIRTSSLEELNFMVNDAFYRGTGAGQPKGLGRAVSNPALIADVVRTNATNIDHDDILRMKVRMSPKAFARMVWLANPDTMGELDSLTFTSGSTGILSPYVRYDVNGVMSLAGRPVIFNEFSPTLGQVGDLLLWDPEDYLYWEGAGVEGASSIHVQFLTNQTVFRFIYRVDGTPASYSALTPAQGTVTTSPYVALAATT
jgi:HK97 family phage major capsid protein